RPVLMMYYNALPAILCQRAVLNLGYLIGLPILIASLFGNAALRSFFVLTLSFVRCRTTCDFLLCARIYSETPDFTWLFFVYLFIVCVFLLGLSDLLVAGRLHRGVPAFTYEFATPFAFDEIKRRQPQILADSGRMLIPA
ncbi:hypothetical protein V1522DRAFT_413979, partial [Lipomyces starkeyi]